MNYIIICLSVLFLPISPLYAEPETSGGKSMNPACPPSPPPAYPGDRPVEYTQLQCAAWLGNIDKVMKLIKEGADPNEIKGILPSWIIFADACYKDLVELILKYGDPITYQDIACGRSILLKSEEIAAAEEMVNPKLRKSREEGVVCLRELLFSLRNDFDSIAPKNCTSSSKYGYIERNSF